MSAYQGIREAQVGAHVRRRSLAIASAPPVPGEPAVPAWPYRDLDPEQLAATGWRPTPLREFVLKIHQRCNLACDYCYVYTLQDMSWRDRPRVMSRPVWEAAVRRIVEHATAHELPSVSVVFHGGEPLLAGPAYLGQIAGAVRAAVAGRTAVRLALQTNGVLLTERILRVLREYDIKVGVSVDGSESAHDSRRPQANGQGSYRSVVEALQRLTRPENRSCYGGLLCVVDPTADPVGSYESLLRFDPPAIDLLLPHATHATPPERADPTAYGSWLRAVFDRWYDAPVQETRIRLFESIISLALGGTSRSEHVGLSPAAVAVIESDGAIEQTDALKAAYPGAAATGYDVHSHTFDDVLRHPGVIARQLGVQALGRTCRQCPIGRLCGGGHYVHRYAPDTGFRGPSVYCDDLLLLIHHIQDRVGADIEKRRR